MNGNNQGHTYFFMIFCLFSLNTQTETQALTYLSEAPVTPSDNRTTVDLKDIRRAQTTDEVIHKVYTFVKTGKRLTANQLAQESPGGATTLV